MINQVLKCLKIQNMKKILLLAILVININGFSQVPPYVPTSGLVGWWPFSGNANDLSVNANNGTLVGGTILTTDRFGSLNSAYAFDGNGDYIDCGNAPSVNITGSLTISAWLFASDLSDTRGIVTKSPLPPVDDAYQLVAGAYVLSDLNFLNSDYGYLVPTLSWVHIVSVFDSSSQTISLFTNGLLDTTLSVAFSSIGMSSDNLCLGTHRPTFTSNWSWNGILDDIGIWDRALTPIEVLDLFNGSSVGVAQLQNDTEISIFPNPANDVITIQTSAAQINSTYDIVDVLGNEVLTGKIITESTSQNISSLSKGFYFIKVDGQSRSFKIIKQ